MDHRADLRRLAIALFAFGGAVLLAQRIESVNLGPTPPPRVNPDLSVTYFLNAPNATEVRLGDTVFAPLLPGIPMTKGPDGMWSATTPPYELGTHFYGFLVDGVTTGDIGGTARTDRMPRGNVFFESVDVRGPEPLFTDIRKVPHGTVHIETFSSTALDREVRCLVYTPPGFVAGERLPIVYLLHGTVDYEGSWSNIGYAERIADNLIAGGQARRVILAMPDTGTSNRDTLTQQVVEPYLIPEVIPFVEGAYLPSGPAAERYLIGYSTGALHTRYTGLRNPSLFSGLGLFSGGGLVAGQVLEDLFPALRQPELYRHMTPIYFAVGNEDTAAPNIQRLVESLNRLAIPNSLTITSGGHTWFNWRRYLAEFLKGI